MSITFIIPSVARPSVIKTLESIVAQEDKRWRAIVIFDGIKPEFDLITDDRITYLLTPGRLGDFKQHGHGGAARNYGIKRATTNWLGFVDDDDTITPNYTALFYNYREKMPVTDLIIFRMTMQGAIYPPDGWGIEECKVGISFACSRHYLNKHNIWFKPGDTEDFRFLADLRDSGCKYMIAPEVTYVVHG